MKNQALLLVVALAVSLPAWAVDGVVLINQSTVIAAGGFPYKITQPGSYKLTGNLTPPAGVNGIDMLVDNVTLDLNGFSILGGWFGITGKNSEAVMNGTVKGVAQTGISLGSNARVERVMALNNGYNGVDCGSGSLITANIATGNGHSGIQEGGGSTITGNTASGNDIGILAQSGSTLKGNTANGNTDGPYNDGRGIEVICPVNVLENTAISNSSNLVVFGSGCNFEHNLAP